LLEYRAYGTGFDYGRTFYIQQHIGFHWISELLGTIITKRLTFQTFALRSFHDVKPKHRLIQTFAPKTNANPLRNSKINYVGGYSLKSSITHSSAKLQLVFPKSSAQGLLPTPAPKSNGGCGERSAGNVEDEDMSSGSSWCTDISPISSGNFWKKTSSMLQHRISRW
jgi:hypothetical protein